MRTHPHLPNELLAMVVDACSDAKVLLVLSQVNRHFKLLAEERVLSLTAPYYWKKMYGMSIAMSYFFSVISFCGTCGKWMDYITRSRCYRCRKGCPRGNQDVHSLRLRHASFHRSQRITRWGRHCSAGSFSFTLKCSRIVAKELRHLPELIITGYECHSKRHHVFKGFILTNWVIPTCTRLHKALHTDNYELYLGGRRIKSYADLSSRRSSS
jgi:hypothetical protein